MSSNTFNTSDFLTPTVQSHPGCNARSAEPFPIVELPDEMKLEVLKRLDLLDLKQFNQTDRYWANFSSDHQLWSPIATRIGCPITGDPYSQVRSFTEDLLQKAANIPGKKPDDIVQILSAKNPTIDEINKLQNWLKARDTLVVWEELIFALNGRAEGLDLDSVSTSEEVINKAQEFSTWCAGYGQELAQLSQLRLVGLSLTYLPPEIGKLTGLEEFSLCGNNLSSLPPEIGKLAWLEGLNLMCNNLSSLPAEMNNLARLMTLTINEKDRILLTKELLHRPDLNIISEKTLLKDAAATLIKAVALTATAVAAYYFGPSVVETLSPYVFSALGI